ncbi:MAG: hypothetical protein E7458_00010 [Ruminococcaceae bacterium]|nr:hypothetical protein [Oscillospiraceae bacterium]
MATCLCGVSADDVAAEQNRRAFAILYYYTGFPLLVKSQFQKLSEILQFSVDKNLTLCYADFNG